MSPLLLQRFTSARRICGWISLGLSFVVLNGCGETRIEVSVPITPVPPPAISFSGVGVLTGDVTSQATAISADGSTVVGISKSATGRAQAFRWNATNKINALGFMQGGTTSSARAVSADGTVIVGYGDGTGNGIIAFRWTSAGMTLLAPLGNSSLCQAAGVSGEGSIAVGTCVTANNAAFRWTQTTGMVSLGQFGTGSNRTSNASAISSSGNVIVGSGHPALTGAVMWNALNESAVLGFLPGDSATAAANAVSRDGLVIAGYSTDPAQRQRAFRWTKDSGLVSIAPGLDVFSITFATGVSGSGQTIVGCATAADGDIAFIWDAQRGTRRLDTALKSDYAATIADWRLTCATGISDDGRTITGTGVNPNGASEGWWLRLPG